MEVDVTSRGAVLLGGRVTCDGFVYGYPTRVQTHIHQDHMHDFERSKGLQDILVSEATRELLIAEFNSDLLIRTNFKSVAFGEWERLNDAELLLLPNGHMLGSVQVALALPSGVRCGYSGDFAWPIEDVIQVDELVLDSTYGAPECVRGYTQEQAEHHLRELVLEHIKVRPVHIQAHRGTLQRAIGCLSQAVKVPFVASPRTCKECEVYQRNGYSLFELYSIEADEGRRAVKDGRYIRLYGKGDRWPIDPGKATTVTLSAYMSRLDHPVLEYSERAFRVALSNHADFEGTVEYVRATGAKKVLTDNTRGGHAVELAFALQRLLAIEAEASEVRPTRAWGQ